MTFESEISVGLLNRTYFNEFRIVILHFMVVMLPVKHALQFVPQFLPYDFISVQHLLIT